MTREAIGIGETEELAKADALNQLGLSSEDGVTFEILKRAEKKKFGIFGGSPAKVKAICEVSDDAIANGEDLKPQKAVEANTNADAVSEPVSSVKTEEVKKPLPDDYSPAKEAKKYVENVLAAMGLSKITVDMKEEDESAELTLSGDQVGAVIGRRGETLDALQYLAGLVANHTGNSYFRITINTGNYREKREKTLEILGRKLAFKVLKTGKNVSLEPMNPYERRIIHTSVQKVNGAISWSEGEVTNRHVVIGLDPEYKRPYRRNNYNNNYNNNRNNNGRRNYNNSYSRNRSYNNNYNKSAEGSAPKTERAPKNEGGNFSLYGRVDTNKTE